MSAAAPILLAVDAVGGDFAPAAVLEGVTAALAADPALHVLLVGPAEVVAPYAAAHDRVVAVEATELIGLAEPPAAALHAKEDSSIVVGVRPAKYGPPQCSCASGPRRAVCAWAAPLPRRPPHLAPPASPRCPVALRPSRQTLRCKRRSSAPPFSLIGRRSLSMPSTRLKL